MDSQVIKRRPILLLPLWVQKMARSPAHQNQGAARIALMRAKIPDILTALQRCLALRCPVCGRSKIIERPFRIAEGCAACGAIFKREEGFFVGALLINVVTTEVVILLVYLFTMLLLDIESHYALALLLLIGVTFPVAFYHHSWSLWLTFDNLVESLPRAKGRQDPANLQ